MIYRTLISSLAKATLAVTFGLTGIAVAGESLASVSQSTQESAQSKATASHAITISRTKGFRPPPDSRRRSGYRTTTGTRQASCVGDTETAFTTLGPSELIGFSASSTPTFAWYLPPSETSYPVNLRLLAPNEQGIPEPIYTKAFAYTEGIMTHQLPPDAVALSPGIEYRWQIVVVCDSNYLSRSLNQERAFEIVPPTAEMQAEVAAATTSAQKALAYGSAGYWYDAIAQVAQAPDAESKAVLRSLLQDLADLEVEDETLSTDLDQLAETVAP